MVALVGGMVAREEEKDDSNREKERDEGWGLENNIFLRKRVDSTYRSRVTRLWRS
jgi:hypothetical protein